MASLFFHVLSIPLSREHDGGRLDIADTPGISRSPIENQRMHICLLFVYAIHIYIQRLYLTLSPCGVSRVLSIIPKIHSS